MKGKAWFIMLVDDDQNDNYIHEREIKKANPEIIVITKYSGIEALEYLKSVEKKTAIKPDMMFLDINMPRMNGWEFLEQYSRLDEETQISAIIIMLSAFPHPDDLENAKNNSIVSAYITKPLTKEILKGIIEKHF